MPENQPIYRAIADTLRAEITGGGYAVGDPFPKEFDLCDRFGVSRHTIRSALACLEREGLLQRQKAVGTVIRAVEPNGAFVQRLGNVDELLQYPAETRLEPVRRESVKADAEMARWFKVPQGSALTVIGGVRSRVDDGAPLCWIDLYILPEYADVIGHIGKDARPVYRIIEDLFGEKVSHVEVEISAAAIGEPEASLLSVPDGTPALKVLRNHTGRGGRVFETSVSLHPQDRFTYTLSFENEGAG
jgi:GntR family transcriptional regulator